jgi:3-oxoadipate enol-lactonase
MSIFTLESGAALDVVHSGSGPDLVLLHSLLADRTAFDAVLPMLAKTRRVWSVNLPGYGNSTPAGPAIGDYADRIAAWMDNAGLPPHTDILGNGLGGFVSVALAIRHGNRFGRLIVADALAGFPPAGKAPLRALAAHVQAEGMRGALDIAIGRMFPPSFVAAHPKIVAERKQVLECADATSFARACLALADVDFAPQLGAIRNQTLVMVGALDATTAPAIARELANGITGAQYMEIPGVGHCPQIEDPLAFVTAVNGFLTA